MTIPRLKEDLYARRDEIKAAIVKRLTTGVNRYTGARAEIKYLTVERSNLSQDIDGVTSYDVTFIDQPGITGQIRHYVMWIDNETCEIVAQKQYA